MMVGSILGNNVKRVEDPRFITGEGRFVDDIDAPEALHLALVRSQVAHGTIEGVDAEMALDMPGVVTIRTAETLNLKPLRGGGGAPRQAARPPLASGRVRFVGDVVAVVVAETAEQAGDAADMVWADIEVLPALSTVEEASAPDALIIHEALESNNSGTFRESMAPIHCTKPK